MTTTAEHGQRSILRSASCVAPAAELQADRVVAALPGARHVLAVCAHPDDESFGLGAVLDAWTRAGATTTLLCFTQGEASTLGRGAKALGPLRSEELACAAAQLGTADTELLDYPDGALGEVDLDLLASHILRKARGAGADTLLVFDEGGITGHPDHVRATEAALVAAGTEDLEVIAWAIPKPVAETLNAELGTGFVGRPPEEIDVAIVVDRHGQRRAIDCHASQSTDNPVLWRRLELLGDTEYLRYLRRAGEEGRRDQARGR